MRKVWLVRVQRTKWTGVVEDSFDDRTDGMGMGGTAVGVCVYCAVLCCIRWEGLFATSKRLGRDASFFGSESMKFLPGMMEEERKLEGNQQQEQG